MAHLELSPKVLIISNQHTTGPLWVMSLEHMLHVKVVIEPDPYKTLARWAGEIPDLVLFDVNLALDRLLELVRNLRAETSIPILMFTGVQAEDFWVQAYQAGVDECVVKPIGSSLFLAKIRVWLRRSGTFPAETLDPLRVGNCQLIPVERMLVMEAGKKVHLTNLEVRLLYCLMSQPGRAISIDNLLKRVWGSNCESDSTVLKNIIYRLRQKVEANPAEPRLVETVAGVGYRFNVIPEALSGSGG